MADNKTVRDGSNATFIGAADELSDGSYAPKVQLLDGSTSPIPISPATSTQIGEVTASPTANTLLDRVKALLTGIVLAAGSAIIGKVNTVPQAAVNGATPSRVASAASTNATSLKASAGQIYDISVFNTSAALKYLKIYNKASAPTVGTDVPTWTIPLPAGNGFSKSYPHGRPFATGIAYAITGALADTDTTAVAADDVHGSILWM